MTLALFILLVTKKMPPFISIFHVQVELISVFQSLEPTHLTSFNFLTHGSTENHTLISRLYGVHFCQETQEKKDLTPKNISESLDCVSLT